MDELEERCITLAKHIIDSGDTVRKTAKLFAVSKSTVHKDVTAKLMKVNKPLYIEVKKVLDKNKSERHIRGGNATKEKFAAKKQK